MTVHWKRTTRLSELILMANIDLTHLKRFTDSQGLTINYLVTAIQSDLRNAKSRLDKALEFENLRADGVSLMRNLEELYTLREQLDKGLVFANQFAVSQLTLPVSVSGVVDNFQDHLYKQADNLERINLFYPLYETAYVNPYVAEMYSGEYMIIRDNLNLVNDYLEDFKQIEQVLRVTLENLKRLFELLG